MNNKIKQVIRKGIVETNSSSSHAISLYMTGPLAKPGDSCWDLDIRDNILYIPIRNEPFGVSIEKTNKCLDKLQYACAFYCRGFFNNQKAIVRLKKMLMSFIGVDDVIFEWDEEFRKLLKNNEIPKDVIIYNMEDEQGWRQVPEVDHESWDLQDEIFETRETLKNFIFNPRTWLYDDSDKTIEGLNSEIKIDREYSETDKVLVSIEFPKPIGRFDIFIKSIEKFQEELESCRVLQEIAIKDGVADIISFSPHEDYLRLTTALSNIMIDNKRYLIFFNSTTSENFQNLIKKAESLLKDEDKYTSDTPKLLRPSHMLSMSSFQFIKKNPKLLEECLEKDKDYVLLPMTFKLLDYEEL